MNYLVMKVKTSYAVLLDEEGRFLIAANLNYQVGDKVQNPIIMNEYTDLEDIQEERNKLQEEKILALPYKKKWRNRVIYTFIAIAAALVFAVFSVNFYQNNAIVFSYVYFTINPDIRMELNKKGNVIDLIGENQDGVDLLDGYRPSSKDKNEVAIELMDRAIDMGYLSDGDLVSIIIDAPNQELYDEYGLELKKTVTEHLDGRISVTISIMSVKEKEASEDQQETADEKEKIAIPVQAKSKEAPMSQSPQSQAARTQTPRTQAPRSQVAEL